MFTSSAIVDVFVAELAAAAEDQICSVPVYCFMPDHLHFIISGLERKSRPKAAVEQFKLKTGFWMGQHMPQFECQDDFYDQIIRKSDDFQRHVQYVASNPLRAGFVTDPFDYPFTGSIASSLRAILEESRFM